MSWRSGPFTAAALLLALACLSTEADATATSLQPLGLTVEGGEGWHAEPEFNLSWVNPPPASGQAAAAVRYRVRDAANAVVVGESRIPWPAETIERLQVPATPGVYTAEVWLEGGGGAEGPPAAAKLRFDRARPGHVDPLSPPDWIGRATFPYTVRLGHSTGAVPTSGIRGYAISIDRIVNGDPCKAADHCTEAETDLHGGAGESSLVIAELPEGTSYLHAVAVSGSGMKSASPGQITLRVDKTDPAARLLGAPSGWVRQPITLTAIATDAASGMAPPGEGASPFTAIRIDSGAPTTANGDSVQATVIGAGVHTVAYYARDAAGNTGAWGSSEAAKVVVRLDPEPPRVAFANAQNPREPETIDARVSDSLSGADLSRGRIAVREAGSGDPFRDLATKSSNGKLQAHWDSDSYLPGDYEFRATGYDVAGNMVTTTRRANGSSMLLRNPLKTPTTLFAGFGGSVLEWHRCHRHRQRRRCSQETLRDFEQRPKVRIVPYGRSVLFSGRLIAGPRTPLAGAPVQVIERFDLGSSVRERVTTVRTGAGGAFSARLAPGPSREIVATMPGTPTLSRSGSRAIRLGVRGGLRMHASAAVAAVGGAPVIFRGRVAGGGSAIPAEGVLIQLQFQLPGVPWTEFRTIRTDSRGRFRYPYRFSDNDSRGARFWFRAFAPAQSDWPFEPGGSRPVAVRGR